MSRKWAIWLTVTIVVGAVIGIGVATATISNSRRIESLTSGLGTFCGIAVAVVWAIHLIPALTKHADASGMVDSNGDEEQSRPKTR